MTSEVIYKGNLRTEATHIQSGEKLITDAPIDNEGLGQSFSPTDMVATALASCIMTIMGIYAKNNGIIMKDARASVEKIMSSGPRRIAEIKIQVDMASQSYSEQDKKRLIRAAEGCPVHRSLSPDTKVTLEFEW